MPLSKSPKAGGSSTAPPSPGIGPSATQPSGGRHAPRAAGLLAALLLLLAVIALSLAVGARQLSPGEVWHGLIDAQASGYTVVRQMRLPRTLLGLLTGAALGLAGGVMQALTRNPLADPGLLGINAGASADVIRTLAGGGPAADAFIVEQVRLPRVVTALLAGGALALSGAVFQSLVRNPLGSPDVLGFTQGAATGALTAIVIVGGGSLAVAGGAVIGGLATGAAIYALAWRYGAHGYRLVLVGIGVAAILTGVNGYLLTRAQITDAARAVLWLTGSLDGRGWGDAVPLLAAMAVTVPLVLLGCGRGLRMLEMGDDAAYALGVRVERLRLVLMGAAVLLSAFTAAAAGPVAFVALIAPQLARRLTRTPGPNLLSSLCIGAALLVSADLAGQRLVAGHQLPVGVMTGMLGGAYLVWLLATERRAGRI